jgi:hypothetical protein
MIPTVQFDPATLAIWTTTGTLPDPVAAIAATAMAAAARGDRVVEALADVPDEPVRTRMLWLASAVWHEKRHYFDTCLTNYGARRFRDLFNLAANFGPLVAHARSCREPVWLPVELYCDPVQRSVFGISQPPPNILEIARNARMMKRFIAGLDAAHRLGDHLLHLGGEAQLEGLAQTSQINSIEHCFGLDDLMAATAGYVHRLPHDGPYRTIEAVSGSLGCTREVSGGTIVANAGLAAALFVTSLCGRFYGLGPQPSADLIQPFQRLARMFDELGPKPGRFDMSDEESAELVDKLARRLWGRTAFEEIGADIDAMEAKVDLASAPWLSAEGLYEVFQDFIALRRRLLKAARKAGPASLLPRAFPLLWRDRLLPWHVVATPGGSFKEEDGRVVFGRKLNVPLGLEAVVPPGVTWGRLHVYGAGVAEFAPQADAAWLQMLERHAPRALIMLNGRRHRRMVPPELERAINEIEQFGVQPRFHPRFEWPEQRDQRTCVAEAVALADFSGRASFVCDITGTEIEPGDAAVVTPWEFRRSGLVARFRESGLIAEVRLITDWSDWVVQRNLLN